MKIPRRPPPVAEILEQFPLQRVLELWLERPKSGAEDQKYLHWDELRRRQPPDGLSLEEWWAILRSRRSVQLRQIPLLDLRGDPHWVGMADPVLERLSVVDRQASGRLAAEGSVSLEANRGRYVYSSLIEEAISSSQLEGAATTRRVAKDMLRAGREPRTPGERMILNNFLAMEHVRDTFREPITPERILELHRIVTVDSLENPGSAGRLRRADELIAVRGADDVVLHELPPAAQLPKRLEELCRFATGDSPGFFVHPVVRAILLHYWLAYDHPFADGNGRTARALFYWSMLANGYWPMEFVSISSVLHAAPTKYGRSFLFTQTDGNDATYFVIQHLDFLLKAMQDLERYLARKLEESREVQRRLAGSRDLNPRQVALLSHALRNPEAEYSVQSHRRSHDVVYESARKDLLELTRQGLLTQGRLGRAMVFRPTSELASQLRRQGPI